MKNLFFILLFIAACLGTSIAQETWKNYSRTNELEINFRYTECHDNANDIHKSIIVLQFVNLTAKPISVSFFKHLWFKDECKGCDNSPEYHFGVRLGPNQTLEGSCGDKSTKALIIFNKMLKVKAAELQKFELTDIEVTTVQ